MQPDSDIQRETYGYYSGLARVVHLERGDIMKKTFLVTMLAVVAFATNVFATEAEAGVLGLKPSANQSVTQSSGNTTNAANTDVQNVQYDTGKYQYPAQQLKAEGKNFDRYDWRLYQRFDNGQLMYYQWAEDTGNIVEEGRYNSSGQGRKYGVEGLRALEPFYVNPESSEGEVFGCPEVDGYRAISPDKIVVFESKRTDPFGMRIQLQTPVFSNPAFTYCQEMTVILPADIEAGFTKWELFELKQRYEFQAKARAEGKLQHVYEMVFYSQKRDVANVRLYRENQNEVLFISADQLDKLRQMLQFTSARSFGEIHREIKNYGFIEAYEGRRMLY